MLTLIIALTAATIGYLQARSFVRTKLRFVDAAQSFFAPLIAGVGAAIIAAPIVWLLPVVGTGTALLFGLGVGAGVSAGAREIRKQIGAGS